LTDIVCRSFRLRKPEKAHFRAVSARLCHMLIYNCDAEQQAHKYSAIHIGSPFDNPFITIPEANETLSDYMRTNGLVHVEDELIPCFETDSESMDIYIACK